MTLDSLTDSILELWQAASGSGAATMIADNDDLSGGVAAGSAIDWTVRRRRCRVFSLPSVAVRRRICRVFPLPSVAKTPPLPCGSTEKAPSSARFFVLVKGYGGARVKNTPLLLRPSLLLLPPTDPPTPVCTRQQLCRLGNNHAPLTPRLINRSAGQLLDDHPQRQRRRRRHRRCVQLKR